MSKMNEKKWYVYLDSSHTGPFSWEEIMQMHSVNKINEHSLIWKEGQSDWLSLGEVDPAFKLRPKNISKDDLPQHVDSSNPAELLSEVNIQAIEDKIRQMEEDASVTPPDVKFEDEIESLVEMKMTELPAVNDLLNDNFEVQQQQQSQSSQKVEEISQELSEEEKSFLENNEDEFESTEQINDSISSSEEHVHNQEVVAKVIEDEKLKEIISEVDMPIFENADASSEITSGYAEEKNLILSKRKKIAMAAVVALIILIMIGNLSSDKKMIPSLKALKTAEAKKLMQAVNSDLEVKVELAPSEDANEIWFATNHKGPGIFQIKLTSIPGRIMSDDDIEIIAKTEFNNYVGVFRYLKMIKGINFAPGEYKLEGKLTLTGRKARLLNYAKDNTILMNILGSSKTNFNIEQEIRVSKFKGEQFETRLKEYHNNKKLNKVKPLLERIEKFRTLITLAEDIINLYKDELSKIESGKEIRGFEVLYSKNMAPILQGLILENHKISVSLTDKDSEEYADYANLLSFGRHLGEVVSDMVTKTGIKPKLYNKTKASLSKQFAGEISKLISHGREYTRNIQKRIEAIN